MLVLFLYTLVIYPCFYFLHNWFFYFSGSRRAHGAAILVSYALNLFHIGIICYCGFHIISLSNCLLYICSFHILSSQLVARAEAHHSFSDALNYSFFWNELIFDHICPNYLPSNYFQQVHLSWRQLHLKLLLPQ